MGSFNTVDSKNVFQDSPTSTIFNILVVLFALPLTTFSLVCTLLVGFWKSPFSFFYRKSRDPEFLAMPDYLAGVKHEHLDVGGGVKLHAVSFGRRPGLPLMLFLHGFPECWYSWGQQLAAFAGKYEVVALDMRGYNTSSKPKGIRSYSLEHLTADVAGAVRALGRSSCTLVAHDWGGAVAWAVAARYPTMVERLVVAAAPPTRLFTRNLTLEQMGRSFYFLWFLLPLLPEQLLLYNDSAFISSLLLDTGAVYAPRRHGAVSQADLQVYKAAVQTPGAATAMLNYYRAIMLSLVGLLPTSQKMRRALQATLPMPVLVVWGEKDHALSLSNLRDIELVAPRAHVHVLPGCSHWVQLDAPKELRRVLEDWLAAHPIVPTATVKGAVI